MLVHVDKTTIVGQLVAKPVSNSIPISLPRTTESTIVDFGQ
jgi:hypothetical protein